MGVSFPKMFSKKGTVFCPQIRTEKMLLQMSVEGLPGDLSIDGNLFDLLQAPLSDQALFKNDFVLQNGESMNIRRDGLINEVPETTLNQELYNGTACVPACKVLRHDPKSLVSNLKPVLKAHRVEFSSKDRKRTLVEKIANLGGHNYIGPPEAAPNDEWIQEYRDEVLEIHYQSPSTSETVFLDDANLEPGFDERLRYNVTRVNESTNFVPVILPAIPQPGFKGDITAITSTLATFILLGKGLLEHLLESMNIRREDRRNQRLLNHRNDFPTSTVTTGKRQRELDSERFCGRFENQWTNLDFNTWFGILTVMMITPHTSYKDYWEVPTTFHPLGNNWIRARMPHYQWNEMLQCLSGDIDELMTMAENSFMKHWNPHKDISVDEMMVIFYFYCCLFNFLGKIVFH